MLMDYFIALFASVISFGCFWAGFKMVRTYLKVSRWNKTEATIVSKNVELRKKYSTRQAVAYRPIIQYNYFFNGIDFTGTNVHLEELIGGQRGYRKEAAEKMINELPEKIMIYFNPTKPEQSVMYCKGVGIYFMLFALGGLAFLIALSYVL